MIFIFNFRLERVDFMPIHLSLPRPTRQTVHKMKYKAFHDEAERFKKLEDLGIQLAKEARNNKDKLKELDKLCQGNNQDKIFNKKIDLANNMTESIKKLRQQSDKIQNELNQLPRELSDLNRIFTSECAK